MFRVVAKPNKHIKQTDECRDNYQMKIWNFQAKKLMHTEE